MRKEARGRRQTFKGLLVSLSHYLLAAPAQKEDEAAGHKNTRRDTGNLCVLGASVRACARADGRHQDCVQVAYGHSRIASREDARSRRGCGPGRARQQETRRALSDGQRRAAMGNCTGGT